MTPQREAHGVATSTRFASSRARPVARSCAAEATTPYGRSQPSGLAVAAIHLAGVDRKREVRRGVAHLRHDIRRCLAESEQQRGERSVQRMWRQAVGQRLEAIRGELCVCVLHRLVE